MELRDQLQKTLGDAYTLERELGPSQGVQAGLDLRSWGAGRSRRSRAPLYRVRPLDVADALLHYGGIMEAYVATLNIKNLPESLYRKLQARARRRRRSTAQEVTHILEEALTTGDPLSILELRGLGKERWRGVEATKHVARERRAWD